MRFLLTLLVCAIIPVFSVSGQESEPPYDSWLEMLSTKNDPRGEKYRAVEDQLFSSDSLRICEVLSTLKAKGASSNRRVQIRLMNLEGRLKSYSWVPPDCAGSVGAEELLLTALNKAYEMEDDVIIFQLYRDLTGYYTHHQFYGKAAMYGMLAREMFEQGGKDKFFPMYNLLLDLGYCLYHNREYRSTIDVYLPVLLRSPGYLRADDVSPEAYYVMFAWNTLGLAYTKLGNPDSAFIAFDHALHLADSLGLQFWASLVKGNIGDVYFTMGKIDSAEVYLTIDYHGSMTAKEYDNAANSLQWLARIDLMNEKPDEALRKSREAYRLLQLSPKPDYMANTLLTFTKVFAALGNADSMNVYMEKFLVIQKSLEQQASDRRTANVMMRLESQKNIHIIQSLNKEKREIELIRNFIIVLILLISFIGFMILNNQKAKLKIRRQKALEEKRIAEHEAQAANAQLKHFTRHLIEKNSLVETLQHQLLQREISEEQKNHIAALSGHVILTEEDWENFKTLFEKVYPGFFYRLRQKSSDLTMADLRIAAMSKLQLSNKEAATLLGIAPNSVLKGRQRLRHRLGLDPETDLEHYLAHSPEFH